MSVLTTLVLVVVAGCQTQPRVVISDLPRLSALQPGPPRAAKVDKKVVKPAVRAAKDATVRAWTPTVNERPWRWIVIHHSATDGGSAAIFDRAHRARGWDELGYHFVINNGRGGRDGQVEVGSRWVKQKWGAHCGKTPNNAYNNYGIGICLVGNSSRRLPSARQLASLRKLLLFLTRRYGIEPDCVIGHRDAPNTATVCPGDALHRYLNEVLRPELAAGSQ